MDPGGNDKNGQEAEISVPSASADPVARQAPRGEFVERLRLLGAELLSSLHAPAFLEVGRERQAAILSELSSQARALVDMAACFEELSQDEDAPEEIQTPQFISAIRRRFQPRADVRGVAFHVNFASPFPAKTVYRGPGFSMLINLLIESAFRHTSRGKVSLELGFSNDRSEVNFVVNDTGAGLSKERLEKDYNEGRFPLEMLGALEVANRLQGSFEVHSLEGVGTSYRGSCPVHFASNSLLNFVPCEEEDPQEGVSSCVDTTSVSGSLLVYEQSFLFSEILLSWLGKVSLDVTYARDLEAEGNLPMSRQFQLVLVDTTGRWEESCRFVQRVKGMGIDVPFMALVLDESLETAIENGFDFIVRMPCDEIKFLRILSCLFRTADSMRKSTEMKARSGSFRRNAMHEKDPPHKQAKEVAEVLKIVDEMPEALAMLSEFLTGLDGELKDVESAIRCGEMDRAMKSVEDLIYAEEMLGLRSLKEATAKLGKAVTSDGIEEIGQGFKTVRARAGAMLEALDSLPVPETTSQTAGKSAGAGVRERVALVENAPEFVRCISDFLLSLQHDLKELEQLSADENWNRLQFMANQLRGTAAFYGFEEQSKLLLDVENSAKTGDAHAVGEALAGLSRLSTAEGPPPAEPHPGDTEQETLALETSQQPSMQPVKPAKAKITQPVEIQEHEPISSELMGSSPELVPLIVEFLGSLDGYLDRITGAANELAWTKLRTVAHELAGVSSMYGYPLCAKTAKSLQAAAEASCSAELEPLIVKLRTITGGMKKGGLEIRGE